MPSDELIHRVKRIYEAIGALEEHDLEKLRAVEVRTEKLTFVHQDFSGGQSIEKLSNIAHSLIHNIANLRDYLRRWAVQNGNQKGKVDETFRNSLALQIVQDLSNNDKHGYPPRDGGCSGRSPKIGEVHRIMQLATRPEKGSWVTMTLGRGGIPRISGTGSGRAIITADVWDRDGKRLGDLHEIAEEAVQAWEQLLKEFGVK